MAGVSERGVDHIETMDGPEILNSVDRIEKLDKVARRTYGLFDGDSHGNNPMVNIALLGIDPEACVSISGTHSAALMPKGDSARCGGLYTRGGKRVELGALDLK